MMAVGGAGPGAGVSLKSGIKHPIVANGFGLSILLAFDFNRDKFLCVFFWMHNG
jgi:hypothetical protein